MNAVLKPKINTIALLLHHPTRGGPGQPDHIAQLTLIVFFIYAGAGYIAGIHPGGQLRSKKIDAEIFCVSGSGYHPHRLPAK